MLESPLQPAKGFKFTAQAKNIHSLGQSKERGQKKKKKGKQSTQLLTSFIQERFILNRACGKLIYWMQQCIMTASK